MLHLHQLGEIGKTKPQSAVDEQDLDIATEVVEAKIREVVDSIKRENMLEWGLFEEAPAGMKIDNALKQGYVRHTIHRPYSDFASTFKAAEAGYTDINSEYQKQTFVRPLPLTDEQYLYIAQFRNVSNSRDIKRMSGFTKTIRNIMIFWLIMFIANFIATAYFIIKTL